MAHELRIAEDEAEMFRAAAEEITARAAAAAGERGRFTLALSGGATPHGLYALLAREDAPYRARMPWGRTHFFWGDERAVPRDHPERNDRMAREAMLSRVPVPEENIHPIRGELADPRSAAEEYEALLRSFFGLSAFQAPPFDLVLLGLGADGHTASLFPGSDLLREASRLVAAAWVERLGSWRITLTPRAIGGAARVVFLVGGASKARALREALEGRDRSEPVPARAIRPESGAVLWIVDRAAADRLTAR